MERERQRPREAEADQVSQLYEHHFKTWEESQERLKAARMVIKGKELPWGQHKMGAGRNRYFLHPALNNALRTLSAFQMYMPPGSRSGIHRHRTEALLYILEGRGYTTLDGVRNDWEAGDLVCVPSWRVHQHFNADDTKPARVLAVAPLQLFQFLGMGEIEQIELSPAWKERM